MKKTAHITATHSDACFAGTPRRLPAPSARQPLRDEQRREELARLLPLWPKEVADLTIAGRHHIIRTLERALRAERRRGRAGHWAYDLSRHAALLATWRSECASLSVIAKSSTARPPNKKPAK
ncbi:MAG: hypothetical protein IPL91_00760 [Hyphomicrobium sp.]|jgi:hypothetical protein|nr:hypothetical protein [Hyphomicrobium sp.]